MSNLVVVALPSADDEVWNVSSEPKPHLTICFLGDAETNPNILKIGSYVKEQADRLAPFNLRVDHRGVLGVDEADALFFSEDIPWQLFDFRESLLADVNIRSAYNSVPQHTKWSPHLTLGYPATPAKKDTWNPKDTVYVKFDRIGVWFADFGGIEIPLLDNSPKVSSIDAQGAWSGFMDKFISHHGVKGMRWGVRRSAPTAKVSVTQKGKKLKTTGGQGRKAAPDAVKVAELRQVRKKSGVHALSNEELQAYSKRLNLEQNVKQLEIKQPGAKNWVKRLVTKQGEQHINSVASTGAAKAGKAALKFAV